MAGWKCVPGDCPVAAEQYWGPCHPDQPGDGVDEDQGPIHLAVSLVLRLHMSTLCPPYVLYMATINPLYVHLAVSLVLMLHMGEA